jgi:hypothetical protein
MKFNEDSNPTKKINILEKKPANGGTPAIENKLIDKVNANNGWLLDKFWKSLIYRSRFPGCLYSKNKRILHALTVIKI